MTKIKDLTPLACVSSGTSRLRRVFAGMLLSASVLLVNTCHAVVIPSAHLAFVTGSLPAPDRKGAGCLGGRCSRGRFPGRNEIGSRVILTAADGGNSKEEEKRELAAEVWSYFVTH